MGAWLQADRAPASSTNNSLDSSNLAQAHRRASMPHRCNKRWPELKTTMSAAVKVLVIDDAPDLLAELVDYLGFCGFDAAGAASVRQMQQVLADPAWRAGMQPRVLVLDLGLPDGDGVAVARRLRAEQGLALGIVMMTARGHLEDRILGLTAGADAYLTKPVAPRELKAVIDALVLRLAAAAAAPGLAGAVLLADEAAAGAVPAYWRVDPATLRLICPGGCSVGLTGAEARLLAALFQAQGQVLNREQLCQRLGHGAGLDDTRRLDSLVSRLRGKVEQQCSMALPLQTFRNLGFAFSGEMAPERRSRAPDLA